MKLLNCLECHDIINLILEKERTCRCGKSSGMYVSLTEVEYSGPSRIICISNEDYVKAKAEINTSYAWYVAFNGANIRKVDSVDNLTNGLIKMFRKLEKE